MKQLHKQEGIEQLTQLRQSFEFLRNYSFELLRATLQKGEKNDT